MKADERGGGVDLSYLFNPAHITRLKRKGYVGSEVISESAVPENVVEKEPLRSNRVLGINAPPPVSDNQGIDWRHDTTPSPRAHPELPLRVLASCRDIHPVLTRLLEYHTIARGLKVSKAVRPAPDHPLLKQTDIRVGGVLEADFDIRRHRRGRRPDPD